ncbi:ABC transporter substrate-binding protein [Candidatus Berkiella cookevillensis]|uniref:Thiamine pyrimidine synthase n=1 Tax=Candidatus Berkiella cookevillensis TaxID=437022 RepID=A0A0Q9YQ03_9GAMM|nr:ABC transporter substrate-binding protein [Candidatus Berkiella cookevillensis]MCS5707807.1 ABC transporter substrate-binding protein [Candidatus Berkiella cookevillensis]
MHVPFLLNWYLNPYHAPLVVAQEMGFFEKYGIDLAIIEPTNPSDVTKIIGTGAIKLGLKAMVHCFAARARGYAIQSIATVLDEPPTGLISPLKQRIKHIADIQNKRIGYVGEFGKIMIDNLVQEAGFPINCYEAIRVGMDATQAILTGHVDAAIGIASFQQIELEAAGMPSYLMPIDEMAQLGCCCFCSIQVIAHDSFLQDNHQMIHRFLQALQQGLQVTKKDPEQAWKCLIATKPSLNRPVYQKIFQATHPYFSSDLKNVDRDWQKVKNYAQRLKITDAQLSLSECYTNRFFSPV